MKNSIINLTDEPNDTVQNDRPTKPVKQVSAKPVVVKKTVVVEPVPAPTEVEETGSAPAETSVPMIDLEKESRHRERYLKHIKNYLNADGAAKAPRRLEPNQV